MADNGMICAGSPFIRALPLWRPQAFIIHRSLIQQYPKYDDATGRDQNVGLADMQRRNTSASHKSIRAKHIYIVTKLL
jgi:hypothetical protein